MTKIGIYVFDDVEELGLSIVYNILMKTKSLKQIKILPIDDYLHVDIISDKPDIIGIEEMKIIPHSTNLDFSKYDILIIPGGIGIDRLIENPEFLAKIAEFGKTKTICGIGMGALVLAYAGLLKDHKATTHHKFYQKLSQFCEVEDKPVVVSDNIITSGGMMEATDLAKEILVLCYSPAIAEIVLDYIEAHRKQKGVKLDFGENKEI